MAYFNRSFSTEENRRDELVKLIQHSAEQLSLSELEALHYDMLTKGYIRP